MMMRFLLWPAMLLCGCIVDDLTAEGRPCPCGAGTICNPTSNTCVLPTSTDLSPPLPDGSQPDGSRPDSGGGLGQSCVDSADCQSGHCVDDVCCDAPCATLCKACNLAGKEGKCSFEPKDTVCAPATCADALTITPAKRCDVGGYCQGSNVISCFPYVCDQQVDLCRTACTAGADCATGLTCQVGACVGNPGIPCTGDGQCTTGHCANGVCCDTACTGLCKACDVPGSEGTCASIPVGHDPNNDCVEDLVSTCGQDGTCDGTGACRKYAYKTICNPGNCGTGLSDDEVVNIKGCDNNGNCKLSLAKIECTGNFLCDPFTDQCHTSCTMDSHCAGEWACDLTTSLCYTTCITDSQCKSSGDCRHKVCDD